MKKRIVLALGGNALGENLKEQMEAVKITALAIADLVEAGHEVVVVHGNGPQVGMINLAMDQASKATPKIGHIPLTTCVAMSQGYIGFDLQNALREELLNRGIQKPVATLVTQTLVEENDEAFKNPTKPIGSFYTEAEAKEMQASGIAMAEDAGRGWRRVVASPKPVGIVEFDTIETLLKAGHIPIAAGGGGIPVKRATGNRLEGMPAVVDKDFASAALGEALNADMLVILTAVEKAAINFGKPDQKWLDELTVPEAQKYAAEGHFAKGSMLPKVEASIRFVSSKPGRRALITMLSKAKEALEGKTGTVVR